MKKRGRLTTDDAWDVYIALGRAWRDGLPVIVPARELAKSAVLFGPPGSGKSVALCSIGRQLIRSGKVSVTMFNPKPLESDLYGTMALTIEDLRRRYPDREYPFWHFSLQPGRSSYLLNVMNNHRWRELEPRQQSQLILNFFSFSHTRNGSEVFFTDSCRKIIEFVLTKARKHGEVVTSFPRLHELLIPLMNPRNKEIAEHLRKHGAHITYLIERMAAVEAMHGDGQPSEVLSKGIDLARFAQEPCFAYYEVNSMMDPAAAGEIVNTTLTSYFSQVGDKPGKVPHIIIVDEFAQVVGRNLASIFRQARATNTGFVLATQSVTDLVDGEVNLLDTVLATTAIQIFKRVSDPVGIKLLQELSGQRSERAASYSLTRTNDGKESWTVGASEHLTPRLNAREIEMVNSDQNLEFVRMVGNNASARFNSAVFINRWDYDRTFEEYRAICNTPWPEPGPGMIVVGKKGPILPENPDLNIDDDWVPDELGPEVISAQKQIDFPPEQGELAPST